MLFTIILIHVYYTICTILLVLMLLFYFCMIHHVNFILLVVRSFYFCCGVPMTVLYCIYIYIYVYINIYTYTYYMYLYDTIWVCLLYIFCNALIVVFPNVLLSVHCDYYTFVCTFYQINDILPLVYRTEIG